jgi:signal transduction histidine kinase
VIFRNLYLIFALGVLLPGLLLAYLSIRTVQDEGLLVERSLDGGNIAFANGLERMVERTCQAHLDRIEVVLRQATSSNTPDSLMLLAAGLLDVPVIQSLIVLRGGRQVLPPPIIESTSEPGITSPIAGAKRTLDMIEAVRMAFRLGRNDEAIHAIRVLLALPDSIIQPPTGFDLRFGFRLLELRCLARTRRTEETVNRVKPFILDLLGEAADLSPQRRVFYLNEAINTVTSLENLDPEIRDWLFHLHQRLDIYLTHAEYVAEEWPDAAREAFSLPPEDTTGLSVRYQERRPYLLVGYPWLDQETRIVARLNEDVLIESVRNEYLEGNKVSLRTVDFRIVDAREKTILTTDSIMDRQIALERPLGRDFPHWRLLILKKRDGEVAALGRRRTALQWLLLLVSCGGLILGSAAVAMAVRHERRTVRLKSNFLSSVSHELKTPLTAIRMFSELLESGRQKEEEKRIRYARLIGEEARRLQGMIEGILSLGRLEDGRAHLQLEHIRPAEIVTEVISLMSGSFAKAEIALDSKLDPAPMIKADREGIRSVIQNLLENALKYSEGGTRVLVVVERIASGVALRVLDQGIGIAKEDQQRIFETFWRAGDEMTRRTQGSGLGLAIVKQIADAHKARVEVNSQPGDGTQISLIFPAEEAIDA